MAQRALEGVFAETRDTATEALKTLKPRIPQILRKWRRGLTSLGIPPGSRRALGGVDIKAALDRLPKMTYRQFREELKRFAAELAESNIESEQALDATYLLLDQCLPFFESNQEHAIAVTRLAGIVAGTLAGGYAARWESRRLTLSHRLVDARRRLHGASAYVTQVYELERRRLSHDLHDEIGHDLVLMKLYLEMLLRDLPRAEPEKLKTRVEQTLSVVQHAIDSARRLVLDLGPAIFDELGFMAAIRSYARQFGQRTDLDVVFRAGPLPEEIPMSHQVALYRILQGALGNVFKHAHATKVTVTLGRVRNGELFLVVEDNGIGFDETAPRKEESVGLIAMRERAEVLGGTLRIESLRSTALRSEHGSRIEVGLPLPKVRSITRSKRKQAG